ncbi:apolipoprotein D and lipocalin family protein [Rhodococcus sp. 27YEA15]|uniref:lipocalin family protein n=1 Tax=Rhodococcus sp. 27YEA15 TaxID=3156259 RepID=UPI003C7C4AA9
MSVSGRGATVSAILGMFMASTFAFAPASAQARPIWEPLRPVEKLDVNTYVGDWYQVAAIPQPFSLACAVDTRASYRIVDSSNISVVNTCTTWSGQNNKIVGNARVTDPLTRAQLHVSFPGVPTQESLDGPPNYIVTYIADDYSWALVGDPLRLSGFVLSRSPIVAADQWSHIREVVEEHGYNACTVLTSPTTAGTTDIRPLCTL